MNKLQELDAAGQSVWLDFIRRDMLNNGELVSLVEDGVRGLTSNPSIFQSAIATSAQYDRQIHRVINAGGSAESAFEELAVEDIQGAADVLAGIYDSSRGADGFVSLEVSPTIANDTTATIANAKRLWGRVDRPNLMIKVPATDAGIPAIEDLIADGLNINVTLMFSMDDYENVAMAFIRGLERRSDPTGVASVASFFVSRVDSAVDSALEAVGTDAALTLRGKIAVANAKLAYARYQELFEGPRFEDLAAAGARAQRVLWASTSTKNANYPDTLYVDALVGENTVNTIPPATLELFRDHGVIDPAALTTDVDEARSQIAELADVGIDFDTITADLQIAGVRSFADAFHSLLNTIREKLTLLAEA
ncbi:MAG: transaldolase [Acidobacteria bacterium]|nr:transaldolase [Acidobacteriota bacterium]